MPELLERHAVPEFLQHGQTLVRRIAGDQGRVDGADRGADDPVGLDAGFVQRLVDSGLVGAERAATLEDEHDLAGVGSNHSRRTHLSVCS